MSNGVVIYRGPSMLDGSPIVAIATGLEKGSSNSKTGTGLIQTWILREDMTPLEAVNSGADSSICGDCRHRGESVDGRNVGRSCYVTVFQAPLNVWKSHKRGIYPKASRKALGAIFAGRLVRLGSYGDPAAVPSSVWQAAMSQAKAGTGYSHQWRRLAFQELKSWCMASCDTAEEREEAVALGWRTFRVRSAGEALAPREVICPASEEAGHKTTCSDCRACGGLGSKARANIAIIAHGAASKVKAFNEARAV